MSKGPENRPIIEASKRVAIVAGLTAANVLLPAVIAYEPQPTERTAAVDEPHPVPLFERHEMLGKGVLVDYRAGSGVDCKAFGPFQSATQVDNKHLDNDSQYLNYPGPATMYIGEVAAPPSDGYYSLKSGWALRYRKASHRYDLYSFTVKPEGYAEYPHIPVGTIYGEKIKSFSLRRLIHEHGLGYSNGRLAYAVAADPDSHQVYMNAVCQHPWLDVNSTATPAYAK